MGQIRTQILSMALVPMLLLTGCGGPSAAEGAEPSSTPKASAPVQETQGSQETPPPQEETPAVPEINTWTSMRLINGDLIIAQGTDEKFAILDRDGTVKTTLSDCTSVDLVNQNCFVGFLDGTRTLYDLDGSVILTSQTGFKRAVPISSEDPWGIIMYEVAEKSDFGGKNTTHFMRMDTLEDVWQVDGDMSSVVGMLDYDGTQYVIKSRNQNTGAYTYLTLDGTELPDYQEADPLAARVEYGIFLEDLGYRKIELLGNGIGGLGRNKNVVIALSQHTPKCRTRNQQKGPDFSTPCILFTYHDNHK